MAIDTSTFTTGRTQPEAYRAMYLAFCVDRLLDVGLDEDSWSDEDTQDWNLLASALAESYK